MPKKKAKKKDEEEIIIGYNVKKKQSIPPKKKLKKRKKKKKTKKNNLAKKILKILLKIFIILAIATAVILLLFVSPIFCIKTINIIGAEEISESVYIAMSGIEIGENIFEINKIDAISKIEEEAYVESAQIKTIYPDKIEINIIERKASYIVEQNSKYYYIDKNRIYIRRKLCKH